MKIERSSSATAKSYWERIERSARKADEWPSWKKTDWVTERPPSPPKAARPKQTTRQA